MQINIGKEDKDPCTIVSTVPLEKDTQLDNL